MKKNTLTPPLQSRTISDQEMHKTYHSVEELLNLIDGLNHEACKRIYTENYKIFWMATGSIHNHQAWKGGYLDHIQEIMNLAVVLYNTLNTLRELPFTLSDALLVLFIHDLEKPWIYAGDRSTKFTPRDKQDRQRFREKKLAEYHIVLTDEQDNAFRYVEGEVNGSYTPKKRQMNELAAFCNICDVVSARLWHDRPLKCKEDWGKRNR